MLQADAGTLHLALLGTAAQLVGRDSRSVSSEPFIGMFTLGLNVRHRNFVMFLGSTSFTRTFKTERQHAEFGTLSLSWFH